MAQLLLIVKDGKLSGNIRKLTHLINLINLIVLVKKVIKKEFR